MTDGGRFRGVSRFTEKIARRMGVDDVPDRTPEEERDYWRAWDRLAALRRRHPWLKRSPTLVQWAAVMLSFRLEQARRFFFDEDGS